MGNNNNYTKYKVMFNSHFRYLIESSSKEQIKNYILIVTFSSQSTTAEERAPFS